MTPIVCFRSFDEMSKMTLFSSLDSSGVMPSTSANPFFVFWNLVGFGGFGFETKMKSEM